MNRLCIRLLVLVMLSALIGVPSIAESDAETRKWFEQIVGVFDRAPLRVSWSGTLDFQIEQTKIEGTMSGDQLFQDMQHQRLTMSMSMSTPQGKMNMNLLSVRDGKSLWNEMEMPGLGRQVTRMSVSTMEQMASAAGMNMNLSSVDPAEILRMMEEFASFESQGRDEDGRVVLEGALNSKALDKLNLGPAAAMVDPASVRSVLRLDPKTIFPLSLELLVDGTPFVTMSYSDVQYLDRSELDEAMFVYTPPEGVVVTDLDAQFEQLQAAPASEL